MVVVWEQHGVKSRVESSLQIDERSEKRGEERTTDTHTLHCSGRAQSKPAEER